MMPSAKAWDAFITWFTERAKIAIIDKGHWTQELEDWAICVADSAATGSSKSDPKSQQTADLLSHHYNEPPVPPVTGLVTQIVLNYENVDLSTGADSRCKAMGAGVEIMALGMGYPRGKKDEHCQGKAKKLPTIPQTTIDALKTAGENYLTEFQKV
ncbi:MAG: hypothetical protein D6744_09475 [Planctomycetota bacterium]|nr:MAG: hypothetical protein D6744_09475 [Planctomycetota bacterium]